MTRELELAWQQRYQHPQRAAQSVANHPESLHSGVVRAYATWRDGDYDHTLQLIRELEAGLRGVGSALWLARALHIKGVVLSILGQAAAGLPAFKSSCSWLSKAMIWRWKVWRTTRSEFRASPGTRHSGLCGISRGRATCLNGLGWNMRRIWGLALMNLAVTQGALGDAQLEAELLIQAGELLVRTQAWSFWSGVINTRAQRLAAAGDLEAARVLFSEAAALDLPNDSTQRLRFGQAKVEAKYGDAHAAQQALMGLESWARVRQDFLDTYLETRATAQARSGDSAAAYATLSELLEIIRGLHAHERTVQLRAQEQQPYRDRSAALEVLTRQDALTGTEQSA